MWCRTHLRVDGARLRTERERQTKVVSAKKHALGTAQRNTHANRNLEWTERVCADDKEAGERNSERDTPSQTRHRYACGPTRTLNRRFRFPTNLAAFQTSSEKPDRNASLTSSVLRDACPRNARTSSQAMYSASCT